MTISVTNMIRSGLTSIMDATFRTPHAVSIHESDDLYRRKPTGMQNPMGFEQRRPTSAARDGRSGEQLEHETLLRIRDALYADRQS